MKSKKNCLTPFNKWLAEAEKRFPIALALKENEGLARKLSNLNAAHLAAEEHCKRYERELSLARNAANECRQRAKQYRQTLLEDFTPRTDRR